MIQNSSEKRVESKNNLGSRFAIGRPAGRSSGAQVRYARTYSDGYTGGAGA